MLQTRLVVRLLDADRALLGWAECLAEARGDGMLRITAPVPLPVTVAGIATAVSVHWPDVHVAVEQEIPAQQMRLGEVVPLWTAGAAVLTLGTPPTNLPAVTVDASVRVGIPAGAVAGAGTR